MKGVKKKGRGINKFFREMLGLDTDKGRLDFRSAVLQVKVVNQLNAAMESKKITKRKLSTKMGISKRELNDILRLDVDITLETMVKIEDALGMTFDIKLKDNVDML